jgi:hypothetical protein
MMGIIAPIIMLSFAKSKHALMNKIYHVTVTLPKHLILFQPAENVFGQSKVCTRSKTVLSPNSPSEDRLRGKTVFTLAMGKLQLSGQNLGRVFNSRLGRACMYCATAYITKQPNLKLKTWHKQLIGSLLLAFKLTV